MKPLSILVMALFAGFGGLQAQAGARIEVGDIYYADGSFSKADAAGINAKHTASAANKPIGVVYHVEDHADGAMAGQRGWVIALRDACALCPWGDMDTDQGGIPNCASRRGPVGDGNEALADTDGHAHTRYMNSAHRLSSTNYPAFYHAHHYNDGSTTAGAGLWYLPAAGQLCRLYAVMAVVAASFDALNSSAYGPATAEKMDGRFYWSSSEFSALWAWDVRWDKRGGYLDTATNKGFNGHVRSSRSF